MLFYKITLTISCTNEVVRKLDANTFGLNIIDHQTDLDTTSLSLMHAQIFAPLGHKIRYEKAFEDFIDNNQMLFEEYGNSIELLFFTEVYYSGDQCNFEALDKTLWKRLAKLGCELAFPISVYHLKKSEMKALLKEAKL